MDTIEIPKKLSYHEKIQFFQDEIVKKQLSKFNLTWDEFKEIQKTNPNWEKEYMLTEKEYQDLEDLAYSLLKRLFKWNKSNCQREWSWFSLNNTLSVKYDNDI